MYSFVLSKMFIFDLFITWKCKEGFDSVIDIPRMSPLKLVVQLQCHKLELV